jgi:hypothetical protein
MRTRTDNGKGKYGEMIMQLAPALTPQGPKSSGCAGVAYGSGFQPSIFSSRAFMGLPGPARALAGDPVRPMLV